LQLIRVVQIFNSFFFNYSKNRSIILFFNINGIKDIINNCIISDGDKTYESYRLRTIDQENFEQLLNIYLTNIFKLNKIDVKVNF